MYILVGELTPLLFEGVGRDHGFPTSYFIHTRQFIIYGSFPVCCFTYHIQIISINTSLTRFFGVIGSRFIFVNEPIALSLRQLDAYMTSTSVYTSFVFSANNKITHSYTKLPRCMLVY